MGCDIHFHTEVKVNGRWEHYSHPKFTRSYWMFTLLANVRNHDREIKPFKEGGNSIMPEDANIVTKNSLGEDRGYWFHHFTVYDSKEIKEFYKYLEDFKFPRGEISLEYDYIGFLEGNGWDDFPDWIEDVRWIFAFDN